MRNAHAESHTCTVLTRVIDAEGIVLLKMQSEAVVPANSDHTFWQVRDLDGELHL